MRALSQPRPRITGASSLRIEAWPDPLVEAHGHDPRSSYVSRTGNVGIFESCEFLLSIALIEALEVTG